MHERLGRRLSERPHPHRRLGRTREQFVEQFGIDRRLARPDCAEHREPQLAERARQDPQPAQRRRVGPMDIIDQEHRRATLGEVARQPDQSTCGGVHRIARVRRLPGLGCERSLRQARGADRQLVPAGLVSQRLEQLARRPPGGVLLERAAASMQHRRAVRARDPPGGGQQRRLPDPSGSFDDDHSPGYSGPRNPSTQRRQLGVPVQQHSHRRKPYAEA